MKNNLTFTSLIGSIRQIHDELEAQASRAVNVSLSLRNWLIGYYITEYQLNGADRAVYGENLLLSLSLELEKRQVSNSNKRQLYRYLRFYRFYPQIVGTLSAQLQIVECWNLGVAGSQIQRCYISPWKVPIETR